MDLVYLHDNFKGLNIFQIMFEEAKFVRKLEQVKIEAFKNDLYGFKLEMNEKPFNPWWEINRGMLLNWLGMFEIHDSRECFNKYFAF